VSRLIINMTKKDFILLAQAVRGMNITSFAAREVERKLTKALASANPRFDAERFHQACQPIQPC